MFDQTYNRNQFFGQENNYPIKFSLDCLIDKVNIFFTSILDSLQCGTKGLKAANAITVTANDRCENKTSVSREQSVSM